jgi:hydrogenase 3 maturation protease
MSRGAEILGKRLRRPVVVLGIGNRWRGDDAAGPCVVDRVAGRLEGRCIDAGEAPERHLGEATAGEPGTILVVDAVDFGGATGDLAVFEEKDLPERAGTTHDTPLGVLMRYAREESGAEVVLIGIQPGSVAFGARMSEAVREGVTAVADFLVVRFAAGRVGRVCEAAGECPTGVEEGS